MDAERKKPGPDEERLKLDEDNWKEAAKKALKKERPEGGWPKGDDNEDDENESVDDELGQQSS